MLKTCLAAFAALALCLPSTASAEAYPERPVQMMVPFAPGGGSDLVIRVIEKDFQKEFGQPLTFVYKPGASGAVGVTELKKLPADGYTLCSQSYPHIIIQELSKSGDFTVEDFDYLGMVAADDIFFAVRNKSKFKDIHEFIAAAKANPGTLSLATTDTLGCTHMAALKLHALGVPVNIVTYAGGSKAVAGLLGNQVDALMVVKGAAVAAMSKMRMLAVCNKQRDAELKDVPTFPELGYDIVQFNGRLIIAPKGLPADVKGRLISGLKNIYADPDVVARNKKAGFETRFADGDTVYKMFQDLRPEATQLIDLAAKLK